VQDELAEMNQQSQPQFKAVSSAETTMLPGSSAVSPAEERAIENVLTNALSRDLSKRVKNINRLHGHTVFGEVLVTDRRGALVAANNKASDFWQNDEAWWLQTAENGIYVADKHYDESAAMESIAICMRIDDSAGNMLGVIKAVLDIQDVDSIIQGLPTARVAQGDRKAWLLTTDGIVLGAAHLGSPPYRKAGDRYFLAEDSLKRGLRAVTWKESEQSPVKLISFARPVQFGSLSNANWIVLVECEQDSLPSSWPTFHYALKFIGMLGVICSGSAAYFLSRHLLFG
jgi:hypothetical protein